MKDQIVMAFGIVRSGGQTAFNLLKAPIEWLVDKVKWLLEKIPSLGDVGGFLGDLAGGAAGAATGLFKAAGGPVSGARSYIVGERGPELFTPGASGFITPADITQNVLTRMTAAGALAAGPSPTMPPAATATTADRALPSPGRPGETVLHNHITLVLENGEAIAKTIDTLRLRAAAGA
jgi:hypothetical protein